MSLSLSYRSDSNQRHWQLTGSRLLVLLMVQGLLLLGCGYLTYHSLVEPQQTLQRIDQKQQALTIERQQLVRLQQDTEQQLSVLAARMGMLTARMNRIDALGSRLASQSDMTEFDFEHQPSVGGPSQYANIGKELELVSLMSEMDGLLSHIDNQQQQLEVLETLMLNHHIEDNSRISGRPVNKGWLSSYYGMRHDPFNGRLAMHKGVDFAGKQDEPVLATGAGVVSWSGSRYGYGLLVEIDHGGGLKTRYGHANKLLVAEGDIVTKGQQIALLGNTGRSTGPHVHYEVLNSEQQVDPKKYIYRR